MWCFGIKGAKGSANYAAMRILKNTVGILATLMLLFSVSSNAQTRGHFLNESDHSVVLRVESDKRIDKPAKIILVYDSNLITLESTSSVARSYKSRSNPTENYYTAASQLEWVLAVEIEGDIPLEDWMLSPFGPETLQPCYLKEETEEELVLEPWMLDLSTWTL